jgi:DNA-binding LytR/AlgR family response regulator
LLGHHEHIDLIFLDIGLPGMSGIELKKHIVLMDNIDYIVFVSGYKERVWESFSKKTLGFIIKPFKYENISVILDNYIKTIKGDIRIDILAGNGCTPVRIKMDLCLSTNTSPIPLIL